VKKKEVKDIGNIFTKLVNIDKKKADSQREQ